jgi:chorismate dehydratase
MKNEFEYVYDLGEEWKSMTGLPFVFAVWVATKKLETSMISEFNLAFKNGIDSIPDFCHSLVRPGLNDQTIRVYLQHYIQFEFGELQRKGLDLFQSYLRHLSLD